MKMRVVSLIRFRVMLVFGLNGKLDIKDEVLELVSIDWLSVRSKFQLNEEGT